MERRNAKSSRYRVVSWSIKGDNPNYISWDIRFRRVEEDQRSMEETMRHPLSEEIDDFVEFKRHRKELKRFPQKHRMKAMAAGIANAGPEGASTKRDEIEKRVGTGPPQRVLIKTPQALQKTPSKIVKNARNTLPDIELSGPIESSGQDATSSTGGIVRGEAHAEVRDKLTRVETAPRFRDINYGTKAGRLEEKFLSTHRGSQIASLPRRASQFFQRLLDGAQDDVFPDEEGEDHWKSLLDKGQRILEEERELECLCDQFMVEERHTVSDGRQSPLTNRLLEDSPESPGLSLDGCNEIQQNDEYHINAEYENSYNDQNVHCINTADGFDETESRHDSLGELATGFYESRDESNAIESICNVVTVPSNSDDSDGDEWVDDYQDLDLLDDDQFGIDAENSDESALESFQEASRLSTIPEEEEDEEEDITVDHLGTWPFCPRSPRSPDGAN